MWHCPAPPHAYVPGRTPRHAEGAFDALRDTARAGMTPAELMRCDAWRAGWRFLDDGFAWEAHEVWEPVWMALPAGSRDRAIVQASIQIANAALKLRMGRPRAALRLCRIAAAIVAGSGPVAAMGMTAAALHGRIAALRAQANLTQTGADDVHHNAWTRSSIPGIF